MKPVLIKKIRFLSLCLGVLSLLFGGFWTFSIFQAKQSIEQKIKSLKEQGHEIQYETLKIHQFFPTITLKVTKFVFDNILISNNEPFSLKIDALLLSFSPFSPKKIKVQLPSLTGHLSKESHDIILGPSSFEVNLSRDSFYAMGSSDFINIQTPKTSLAHLEDLYISITPHTLVVKNDEGSYETPGLNITCSLKKLSLNQPSQNEEPDVENISFSSFLMEKIDFTDFPKESLKTLLTHWRDQGGALDIQQANMSWGDLTLSFQGTLALDETLNPEGSFTSTVKGIPEFLKQLSQNQSYSKQDRLFLELSLGFLSGTSGEITLPLTLQNQTLRLGNFININLPSLPW